MAPSKQSNLSHSITIRIPNDVYEKVFTFGETRGLFKTDGKVNTSEAVNTLLKQALGMAESNLLTVSNISNTDVQKLQDEIKRLDSMFLVLARQEEVDRIRQDLKETKKLIDKKIDEHLTAEHQKTIFDHAHTQQHDPAILFTGTVAEEKVETKEQEHKTTKNLETYKPKGLDGEILTLEEDIPESETKIVKSKELVKILEGVKPYDKWEPVVWNIKKNRGDKWQSFKGIVFKYTGRKEEGRPANKAQNLWFVKIPQEAVDTPGKD